MASFLQFGLIKGTLYFLSIEASLLYVTGDVCFTSEIVKTSSFHLVVYPSSKVFFSLVILTVDNYGGSAFEARNGGYTAKGCIYIARYKIGGVREPKKDGVKVGSISWLNYCVVKSDLAMKLLYGQK